MTRAILLAGLLALQAGTPSVERQQQLLAAPEVGECEAALEKLIQKPLRIVVPYNYAGDICYQTFGESLVCETPGEWQLRRIVKRPPK